MFLNADDFAETLVFLPKGGDSREIVGVADRTRDTIETPDGLKVREFLVVECLRSSTGIPAISHGDGIRRATDPEWKVYSYEGGADEDLPDDEMLWTLTFVRDRPYEIGGNRIQ